MSDVQPIVTGVDAAHAAIVAFLFVVALGLIGLWETRHERRARRNEQQIRDEYRLRRGAENASLMGLLPRDDTQ